MKIHWAVHYNLCTLLFSVLYLNLKSILKNKKWWNNGITSWIWSLILALFSLHSISKMSTCQIQLFSQRISSLLSSQSIFKYILLQKSQSNITVLPCKRSFLFSIIFLKSFSVIPNISSFYQAFNLELIDTLLFYILKVIIFLDFLQQSALSSSINSGVVSPPSQIFPTQTSGKNYEKKNKSKELTLHLQNQKTVFILLNSLEYQKLK